jgi:hypothetical protein
MHYKNGREAKNGDKVVMVSGGRVFMGVLHEAVAGNDACNGQLAVLAPSSPTYANLKECLHFEDVLKVLGGAAGESVPDTSKT